MSDNTAAQGGHDPLCPARYYEPDECVECALIAEVRADEREACALIAEAYGSALTLDAIRARGQEAGDE